MIIAKNKKFLLVFIIPIVFGIFFGSNASAQSLSDKIIGQLDAGKTSAGYSAAIDPQLSVVLIIRILLGFVGSFFIVLIAMASYWYIIARGRTEKIEKATKTLRGAIIGLIIVVLSYAITSFVASGVQKSLKAPESSSRFDCLNTEEGCW